MPAATDDRFDVVDTRTGHATLRGIAQGPALSAAQTFNAGWPTPAPFRVLPHVQHGRHNAGATIAADHPLNRRAT